MNKVIFFINGKKHIVTSGVDPDSTLNEYIRNHAHLKGTKAMCHEGGCGACIVSVEKEHPVSRKIQIFSVNSCLINIFSCHDWSVTTVEGLGRKEDGYNAIQNRLAGFSGTQCGYCTPGWVMNMYSLYEGSDKSLTMKEVENSFASNMCRCTGYRPILDAFKSFTTDCDKTISDRLQDIEDLSGIKMCLESGKRCRNFISEPNGFCDMEKYSQKNDNVLKIQFNGVTWYKVDRLEQVFNIWDKGGIDSYMLVAGNTAQGVYRVSDLPRFMINIADIKQLRQYRLSKDLIVGAGMTLNEAMAVFKETSESNENFKYLQQFYHHLDLVAHIPVRNVGTIAGNLSIKHSHREFPSDVFLLLETVGATVTLLEFKENSIAEVELSLMSYLDTDMRGKIILNVRLPPLSAQHVVHSNKIMPRAQNAHAMVNAGFMVKFNDKSKSVIEEAVVVYGCISLNFIHARNTEKFLIGKNVFNPNTLMAAFNVLESELIPENNPPEPSPEFRKKLALGLFYKFILRIAPRVSICERHISGSIETQRPVSSGRQFYDTNRSVWPLNKPVPKIEALIQCTGDAEFTDDIPRLPNEVHVAFVLSTVHGGQIEDIRISDVLKVKGVLAFFSAKDIPGDNSFTPIGSSFLTEKEEIFADGTIKFYGQPIGIILAENPKLANRAAKLIKITYKNVPSEPPVLTVRDAMAASDKDRRIINNRDTHATAIGDDVTKILRGSYEVFGQYHYTMEPQTCLCVPDEDGMKVFSATQSMDLVQISVAESLSVPLNYIHVESRRLGGGYGAKASRASLIACACALATHLLRRPARLVMPLTDSMVALGKRNPCTSFYEVGINNKGEIQHLKNSFYGDQGASFNEAVSPITLQYAYSGYDRSRWSLSGNSVLTDTAGNTYCRGPGSVEGVASTENIMERIAVETGIDPLVVRLANLDKGDDNLQEMIQQILKDSNYYPRLVSVKRYNKHNRWRKRGISLVPMKYEICYWGYYPAFVSIYHRDGTVTVSHGGIEMGQGLNTKVAQVCAHVLGIELSDVRVRPSNTHTAPNSEPSAASIVSETCAYAAMKACQTLLDRLEPVKKRMKAPTWKQLVAEAYKSNVTLSATHTYTADDEPKPHFVYGVIVTEVEVDILTGGLQILRVDILEDTGESMSPEVDIGQIEGSIIMAFGYWTTERLVYDKKTGALLTNRTWDYKPPGAKDIPIDFWIQLRRNSENKLGVLRSKTTGEPPLCMAVGITHAIRAAITSAREDAGYNRNEWYDIKMPCTTENILLSIGTCLEHFTL